MPTISTSILQDSLQSALLQDALRAVSCPPQPVAGRQATLKEFRSMAFVNAQQQIPIKVGNEWKSVPLQDLQNNKLLEDTYYLLAWDLKAGKLVQRKAEAPVEVVVPPKDASCFTLRWNNGSRLQATTSVRLMLSHWNSRYKYDERKTNYEQDIAGEGETAFVTAGFAKGGDFMHTMYPAKSQPHPQVLLSRKDEPLPPVLLMKNQETTVSDGQVFTTIPSVGTGYVVMIQSGVFIL